MVKSIDEQWEIVQKAQALLSQGKSDDASKNIKTLSNDFSHKHYLQALIYEQKGENSQAAEEISMAIKSTEDDQLSKLYIKHLLNSQTTKPGIMALPIKYKKKIETCNIPEKEE